MEPVGKKVKGFIKTIQKDYLKQVGKFFSISERRSPKSTPEEKT